jgi:hypothetical protein
MKPLDAGVQLVQRLVGGDHLGGERRVAAGEGVDRLADLGHSQRAHLGDVAADRLQLLVDGPDGVFHGGPPSRTGR